METGRWKRPPVIDNRDRNLEKTYEKLQRRRPRSFIQDAISRALKAAAKLFTFWKGR